MPFFANSREGPSVKLRKKVVEDQAVDNNTYTPDAVPDHVGKRSLQRRQSADSLTSIKSLSSFAALAQLHQPPTMLTQLTRTTRSLLNISSSNATPVVVNIGKPRFVKRNDSPIYRFPSQKEQLLIEGTEKLVQLEGDVIPGPGVKPKEIIIEPEVVAEEPKKVLKIINLPDSDVEPAFKDILRAPSPPPKPPPLAANRPVPSRRESIPVTASEQDINPVSLRPAPPMIPAQARRTLPNYRGVAAFRFGGSIPGPSPAPRDSKPIPGTLTRANTTKPPAIKILPASPLSQEVHPNVPISPPAPVLTHLAVSHSWQNQRRESLRELAQAKEANNTIVDKMVVERIHQQNIELHNRMQALEENTLGDNRMLLNRVIALEKVNFHATQQTKNNNSSSTAQVSGHVEIENELAALRQQNTLLQQVNDALNARIIDLALQNESLTSKAESVEFYIKAKEEAEINADSSSRKALALLTTIDALEKQNSLDRKKSRDEKDAMRQHAKAEQEKLIEEANILGERIVAKNIECAKHLEDLGLKQEEKYNALKERDNLQKELKVLWVELGEITKITEAGNAKKIADLESQLAKKSEEQANDAIVREKLEREIEVLWAEIRDMHEKQSLKLAQAVRVVPLPEAPATEKSDGSVISLSGQSTPPQSPQTSVSESSSLLIIQPLKPETLQVVQSGAPAPQGEILNQLNFVKPSSLVKPGIPVPHREALNQPDFLESATHARSSTPIPQEEVLNQLEFVKASHDRLGTPVPQREALSQPGFIKPPYARPGTPVPQREVPNQQDFIKVSYIKPGISLPQREALNQPELVKSSHARSGIPVPLREALNQPAFVKSSSYVRSGIPIPHRETINQPNTITSSQIGFSSLRHKDSGNSLRFRRNAISDDEVPKVKSPKISPGLPINSSVMDGARFGYMGMRGRKRDASGRKWKPPGQSRGS